jgi:hypothetical protein
LRPLGAVRPIIAPVSRNNPNKVHSRVIRHHSPH